jgi:ribonucleoside-diphosphate reductase alpha chain
MTVKTNTPNLTENAKFIVEKRYLKIDGKGKPLETPSQMFERVSKFISKAETDLSDKKDGYKKPSKKELEQITSDFYEIQSNLEFLSGMSLLDRGKEDLVAACYVMPIEDSLESIYNTLANTVVLHRRGAGIGYDFSTIRPEHQKVNSTGREASGPISFMRLYDFSSEVILNRGAVRHAGHMGILRIDHPEIEKFISAKEDYSQLTNFNISIAITDEFIDSLNNNKDFDLKFNKKVYSTINPQVLLKKISESIYRSGEPGFIFIDEINRFNPTPNVGKMTATNQCGEQPLLPYEACNLGSIVLNKFVIESKKDLSIPTNEKIDWKRMEFVINTAIRFLDNTITVSNHLLPQIENIVKYGNRKIGLGVMGWADLLVELGIKYDSQEALDLAESIMKYIKDTGHKASIILGEVRGDFGNFKGSRWHKKNYKNMRNSTVTTIAPTGTTSLVADCNGGIEPFFAMAYVRKNMETVGDSELIYMNKYLEKALKKEWLYSDKIMKEVAQKGSVKNIKELPIKLRDIFVSAGDISPEWHIRTQAAFQKYTDNAVTKTINMPESAKVDDVIEAFKLASSLNLKGFTIYRDKSRDKQVLNLK